VLRRAAAVVGIGQSEFAKALPQTAWELALEAILAAVADAGIDPAEVDGICRFAPPFEQVSEPMVVRALGIRELGFFAESPLGGEALGAVVSHASAAIAAGQASVVVCYRALSQSHAGRFGRADSRSGPGSAGTTQPGEHVRIGEEDNRCFHWPYGLVSPGQLFALWATRYAHVHGLSEDDLTTALGTVAITQRCYASNNPAALMRDRPLDWDTYRGARVISSPLRLFDLCLENDGACAVVLAGADRAAVLRDDPVYVLAATQSLSPYREPMGIYTDDLIELFPPEAAARLYRGAGLTPGHVKVAELYDATSFMTLKGLESYGFAKDGQGWRYLIEQGIGARSPLPVNTHGGHLSEAYIHGMNGLNEAVRQLRGTARNQVAGADVALVGAPSGSAVILAR
jgi:acetyl-CoA acetyltransferase